MSQTERPGPPAHLSGAQPGSTARLPSLLHLTDCLDPAFSSFPDSGGFCFIYQFHLQVSLTEYSALPSYVHTCSSHSLCSVILIAHFLNY